MKKLITLLMLFFVTSVYTQIVYEKGYYISEEGKRFEGFIKNEDWSIPPEFINFKTDINSESLKIPSKQISEFEIFNESKFKKFKVIVYNPLIKDRRSKLEFQEQHFLLSHLVAGAANLYVYNGDKKMKKTFFIEKENDEFLQLIHFNVNLFNEKVALNSTFKEDLKLFLQCKKLELDLSRVKYTRESLAMLVKKYSACKNSNHKVFKTLKKQIKLNIVAKAGVSYNNFNISNKFINFDENLNGTGYQIGSEFEFSLPFHKRKWSLFVAPFYTSYKAEKPEAKYNSGGIEVRDSRFQFDFGIRHYFLFKDSKLYTSISFTIPVSENVQAKFSTFDDFDNFAVNLTPAFEVGCQIKERIYLGLNFRHSGNLNPFFNNDNLKYRSLSSIFTLGYKIF